MIVIGAFQSVAEVRHHVEVRGASLPQREVAGAGILAVNGRRIKIRLRLSQQQHVLITRPASTVSFLHEQPILLILVESQHTDGVSQVAVEGVRAVAEIVVLADSISLFIECDHHRIGSAADALTEDFHGVVAILRDRDFKPIGVARLIEPPRDNRWERDRLWRCEIVVRLRFDRHRLFRDENPLSIQRRPDARQFRSPLKPSERAGSGRRQHGMIGRMFEKPIRLQVEHVARSRHR